MTTHVQYLDRARPLRWHEAFAEYVPERHRARARRYTPWLPVALVALLFSILSLAIHDPTAFVDEALYINAGYGYLDYWFSDGAAPDRAGVISGLPFLYPVIAAGIDAAGGLVLARFVSGVMMIITIVLIARITMRLVNYRAGVLAAAALALVGPVIFLGQHATHDAMCITLLVGAAYLGVAKTSLRAALMVGVLLTLAMGFKYTGAAFAVPILALVLFSSGARPVARTLVALATTVGLAAVGLYFASPSIREGISNTTVNREEGSFGVIAPASHSYLIDLLWANLGIMLLIALFGLVVMSTRSWRMAAVALTFAGAAAMLPVSHMMLGELSSFEKHLGWAAVFLAPLAGTGLDRISRTRLVFAPVIVILAVMALNAEVRSSQLVYWGDVSPVLELIEENPVSGTYLAVNATVMDYHTRDEDYDIRWVETYDFWTPTPAWHPAIVAAVQEERFARVIIRGDETGNPAQNAAQLVLVDALYVSDSYQVTNTDHGWRVFTRVDQ